MFFINSFIETKSLKYRLGNSAKSRAFGYPLGLVSWNLARSVLGNRWNPVQSRDLKRKSIIQLILQFHRTSGIPIVCKILVNESSTFG